VAVGGGGSIGDNDGTGLPPYAYLETSRPDPASGTPTGWFIIAENFSGQTVPIHVYADCAWIRLRLARP
jgi:hypothetical protein